MLANVPANPLLKWPGGKSSELSIILAALPSSFVRYYEPFFGGGAVFWSISEKVPAFLNDKSTDLMDFYRCVGRGNDLFFKLLDQLAAQWSWLEAFIEKNSDHLLQIYSLSAHSASSIDLSSPALNDFIDSNKQILTDLIIEMFHGGHENFEMEIRRNLAGKISRMVKLQQKLGQLSQADILDNLEGALKSAYYMHLRYLYNHTRQYKLSRELHSAIFFFLREHAYAAMFRFNSKGQFNVPYGGISYNRKNLLTKIDHIKSPAVRGRLQNAQLQAMDFIDFFHQYPLMTGDFVFVDPPYDSDFSDYDRNAFSQKDQVRLANFLMQCSANFMLVIKETEFIYSLYDKESLNIRAFDKKYMWTIKERNNRDVKHLMITNY